MVLRKPSLKVALWGFHHDIKRMLLDDHDTDEILRWLQKKAERLEIQQSLQKEHRL